MMKLVTVFLAVALGSAFAQTTPPATGTPAMPDGAGKPIVQRACSAATRSPWSLQNTPLRANGINS